MTTYATHGRRYCGAHCEDHRRGRRQVDVEHLDEVQLGQRQHVLAVVGVATEPLEAAAGARGRGRLEGGPCLAGEDVLLGEAVHRRARQASNTPKAPLCSH